MMYRFLVICFSVITIFGCSSAQKSNFDFLHGDWKVIKCISADYNDTVISDEERKRELGNILSFQNKQIILKLSSFNDTCILTKDIELDTVTTNNYFKGNNKLINWMGVNKRSVLVIRTSCESFFLKEMFLIDDQYLIVAIDGFFLYFTNLPGA